eukprot:scaffold381_cov178-Amphora_coffeaeformis.AAC.19
MPVYCSNWNQWYHTIFDGTLFRSDIDPAKRTTRATAAVSCELYEFRKINIQRRLTVRCLGMAKNAKKRYFLNCPDVCVQPLFMFFGAQSTLRPIHVLNVTAQRN